MGSNIIQVLRIRSFLFLWLAEIFSQIAMNMLNFILIIVAFNLAKTNAAVSGIVLAFTLPAILLGLFAGVYVDRWDKKTVLFSTNIARGVLLFGLTLFHSNLLVLYLFAFGISVVTQFFIPAEIPMIPLIVKKELLLSANALFGIGVYGSALVGYALAGPFYLVLGEQNVFFLLAVCCLIAALFITFVSHHRHLPKNTEALHVPKTVREEVQIAFSLIRKTKKIYNALFLLALSQILVLVLAVIGPGFANQILGINVDQFPLLFATPAALGMVVGGVLIGNFFNNRSKQRSVAIGLILSAVSVLLLPYGAKVSSRAIVHSINAYLPRILSVNILHIMVFLSFVLGIANSLVFVPSNTILQEETSDELRGKVYGALSALVGICSIIPIAIVGALADLVGVTYVLIWIGILLLGLGLIRILTFRNQP